MMMSFFRVQLKKRRKVAKHHAVRPRRASKINASCERQAKKAADWRNTEAGWELTA